MPAPNGVPRLPTLLPGQLQIWGFPQPVPLRLNNSLEWLTERKEALYLQLYFTSSPSVILRAVGHPRLQELGGTDSTGGGLPSPL